jgi:sortase (surface protein transpeptidase)
VADPGPSTAGATPDLDLSSSPTAAPSTVGVPTLVDIPAIGVHASITPLGLGTDGVIQVPDQFGQAGWYDGGPRPGDSGPAVLLGHVDSETGPAVFFRLKDLHPGDTVTVTSSTGTVGFVVDSVAEYPKAAFPTAAVYGPVSDRALRLVTCGGKFDDSRHSYLSNVIVFATAAA